MMNVSRPAPGTFVRVPLEDGSFGYGRILSNPYVAFYNYKTMEPSDNYDLIDSQPLLFTQAVHLPDDGRWTEIGWKALEGDVAKPVVQFMQDVMNFRKCTIFDSEGNRRQAEPEECVGLERASVWEAHHIEGRLLDTFQGRPNAAEIHARVRLK